LSVSGPRAELLHVLMLPDFDRADAIGSYWGNPKTRTFAKLLIDCEEDRALRAVLVGMLRETSRHAGAATSTSSEVFGSAPAVGRHDDLSQAERVVASGLLGG
jgi:hypothetical protein